MFYIFVGFPKQFKEIQKPLQLCQLTLFHGSKSCNCWMTLSSNLQLPLCLADWTVDAKRLKICHLEQSGDFANQFPLNISSFQENGEIVQFLTAPCCVLSLKKILFVCLCLIDFCNSDKIYSRSQSQRCSFSAGSASWGMACIKCDGPPIFLACPTQSGPMV